MIVMAIIVGVLTLVAPRVTNPNNQMKAAVRRFTVLSKQLRATAKLQGASYRIVFDLKEREEDEQEYWIERSNNSILLPEDRSILEQEKRNQLADRDESERRDAVDADGFAPDDGMLKGKQKLPDGLRFKSIEIGGLDRPITQGYAYIHFHPQGLVEESAIHFVYGKEFDDNQLNWTIAIHPLTGKADIITKDVTLKEITDQ